MAEAQAAPEDTTVTFHVKSSGGQKYTFTLPLSTTTLDLKNQLATSEYANVPASSQRLIYSGKVLKDTDTLASHNVKEGNTMHLVKSAPSNQRQNPANQPQATTTSGTTPPPAVPQNLASGTGNDPLAGLTGARYAGFAQLPSASMFQNPPSPEDMMRQLQDPNFAQMMREAMNNPQFIDMMINSSPHLRSMGPQARQMLQSDYFRRMMTDPEALRSMLQMQDMMGMNPFGRGAGQEAFPAPGVTNTTDPSNTRDANPQNQEGQQQQQQQQQQNPFGSPFGGPMGANPFAGLFNPFAMPQPNSSTANNTSQNTSETNTTSDTANTQGQQPANPFAALFQPPPQQAGNNSNPSSPPPNPFLQNNPLLQNPEAFNQFLRAMGGQQGNQQTQGTNPPNYGNLFDLLGGSGGFGGPPDNRPPEERYATQLRQLNEMGFHDFDRNIQALSRSGGDVNGALEWLFSQT